MTYTHESVLTSKVSCHTLPAPLVIPQTNYDVFSSSILLLCLPPATLSFQLQLDLDKDGFSFSFLFFPALAKRGFALRRLHTHTETHRSVHTCRPQRWDVALEEEYLHGQASHFTQPPFGCTRVKLFVATGQLPLFYISLLFSFRICLPVGYPAHFSSTSSIFSLTLSVCTYLSAPVLCINIYDEWHNIWVVVTDSSTIVT